MSTDDNKKVNLRWIQAFNERDWQAETACRGLDFQAFVSGATEPLNGDAWAAFMSTFAIAFPDAVPSRLRPKYETFEPGPHDTIVDTDSPSTQKAPHLGCLPFPALHQNV